MLIREKVNDLVEGSKRRKVMDNEMVSYEIKKE